MRAFPILVFAAALAGCEPFKVHESPYSVAIQAKFGDSHQARRRALEHCQAHGREPTFVREQCTAPPCADKVHYFICE